MIAILCAVTWSLALIMFKVSGDRLHPILLNLGKNSLAFFLLVPTLLLVSDQPPPKITPTDLSLLLVSGLIGIGLADAMVLRALSGLGASLMAIVECAYSPFVILLSVLFLGESLTGFRLVGTGLVLAAIILASLTRHTIQDLESPGPRRLRSLLWGVAGLFAMAVGIVMIKPILGHLPLLWTVTIRMGAGTLASGALFAALRDRRRHWRDLLQTKRKVLLFAACFLSTYVSMILWVAGYLHGDASVIAVLNQTSTVFTVIFASLLLKEDFTRLKAMSVALAIGGVLCITMT